MPGTVIPIPRQLVNWRQRTPLGGVDYLLDFRWNGRASRFTFTILDADANVLRAGLFVDAGTNLLFGSTGNLPRGVLTAIDLSGRRQPPTLDNFGESVILKYYTPEELEQVISSG